jgi:hypothetical protein
MLTSPARLCRLCRPAGPAHPAATAGFSIQEGEIPRETDCLLEEAGFEPSVPLGLTQSGHVRRRVTGIRGRSLSYIDPSSLYRYHHTASFSSANWCWGHFTNPKIDELLAKAQETFVPTERDNVLASVSLVRLSGRRLCAFLRALPLRWAI